MSGRWVYVVQPMGEDGTNLGPEAAFSALDAANAYATKKFAAKPNHVDYYIIDALMVNNPDVPVEERYVFDHAAD